MGQGGEGIIISSLSEDICNVDRVFKGKNLDRLTKEILNIGEEPGWSSNEIIGLEHGPDL